MKSRRESSRCRQLLLGLGLVILGSVTAQGQTSARPDRGTMPNRTYSVSDIENISLQNGNVNLSIPLAALPPIAGGKLSWTISAHYNSKLWDVTREQMNLDPLTWAPYTIDTPQLGDAGGWRIGGAYRFLFRNSNEDFYRLQYPGNSGLPSNELNILNNNQWWKVVLRMPDGSEHEFRRTDSNNSLYAGSQDFLRGYFSVVPTGSALRYYSVDGSYLFATISGTSDWTVYMPDGTRVIQTTDGIQRIQDTNGNKIKIFSDEDGDHYQDEQTGREIVISKSTGGLPIQITYPTVTGTAEHIDIEWGTTTVQGKLRMINDNGCSKSEQIASASMEVVREIVFPATEPSQAARQFSFKYNSDSEFNSTATDTVVWDCPGGTSVSYSRTVSSGMGELSQMTTPSGNVVDYSYTLDGNHNFQPFAIDMITAESIAGKEVEHDGTSDTWTYEIIDTTGSVTNPDGSGVSELKYCSLPSAYGCVFDKAGLTYRSTRPFMRTDRHWTNLQFSGASVDSPGGVLAFNPVVDVEYTTLLDGSGNALKMSAKAFQYDYNGNVTQTTEYDWFDPASVSRDAQGVPTGVPGSATVLRTVYNDYYNQASSSSSGNVYAKRDLTYGTPLILNAPKQTTIGDSIVRLSYDGNSYGTAPTVGNLTGKSVYDDVDDTWLTSSMTYDIYGNVATSTDGRGNVTTFVYDSSTHAQPISVTVDPENGTGTQTIGTEYDYYTGLVTRVTDVNGKISTVDYTNQLLNAIDPFGRPGITKSPAVNGSSQRRRVTTYYEDHLLRVTVATDLYAEDDQLLKVRTTTDMLGRPIGTEQTEDGTNYTIVSRNVYEQMGKITYASGPMKGSLASPSPSPSYTDSWTRVTNDNAGRPIEVATFGGFTKPPATGTPSPWTGSVTTAYDGQFTTVTDQAGKLRRSMVDGLGRLVRVDEPDGSNSLGSTSSPNQSTSYDYDVMGNLLHVYQGSQTRTFTYDTLSRLRTAANPESGTITYTYDENGNLLTKVDARSITSTYVYDALNRVTSRSYSDSTPTVTYAYDTATNGKGRLASVSSSVSSYTYSGYDNGGKVLGGTQTIGSQPYSLSYVYDLSGHVTKMTYPSGREVNFNYDNAGRLANKDSSHLAFTGNLGDATTRTYSRDIAYGPGGQMTLEKFGTSTAIYNQPFYNSRGQLAEILAGTTTTGDTSSNRGKIVNDYSLQCGGVSCNATDNNGNLRKQTVYVPNNDANSSSTSWYQQYDYDTLNRLLRVHEYTGNTSLNWQQEYVYDRYGNRTVAQGSTETFGTGIPKPYFDVSTSTNRLAVPSGQSGTMTYDSAGNLTTDTYSAAAVTRVYDAENRMTSETQASSYVAGTYYYDGDGRRVKRVVGSTETWQVYGLGGELLAEYPANGSASNPQKEYGYRNGQLLITAEPASAASGNAVPVNLTAGPTVGAPSTSVTLSWGEVPDATKYRVERKAAGGSFTSIATPTSETYTDSGASSGSAYLYRVCTADSNDDCTSGYSNLTLGARFNFPTDSTITVGVTNIKAAHITELRTAVDAVRSLAGQSAGSWTHSGLVAGDIVYKEDVKDLRDNLNEALTALGIQTANWEDAVLQGAPNGTLIRAVHITQLRTRTTSGSGANSCYKSIEQFVKDFYQGTLQRQPNSTELAQWIDSLTDAQEEGQSELLAEAQDLGSTLFNSTEYGNLGTSNAQFVTDLYVGYLQRQPNDPPDGNWDGYNFWLGVLNGSGNRANLIAAFDACGEFQQHVSGVCVPTTGGTGNIHWLVPDQLGTPRMIFDQSGSLAKTSRHDYLPFGEELFAEIGLRTTAMGYTNSDGARQKFTQKERDNETGLDYFGERYYGSNMGRFTTADPMMASATTHNPQSFNRYTFVLNNPLRYVDPDGLKEETPWEHLTAEEKKIITPKITVAKGQKVADAFNNLATVKDGKGKVNQQATADRITTIKNFIDSAGGHTNSEVWQQIQTVNSIDLGRNASDPSKTEGRVTVSVANKDKFLEVAGRNGYDVNRYYEVFADHPNDSARQITQTSFQPGMHFANDDSSNLNKFYVHWDRRSSAFAQGSNQYWTSWGEQSDAASTHNNPYTPRQLRQELKKNGTVPRGEP